MNGWPVPWLYEPAGVHTDLLSTLCSGEVETAPGTVDVTVTAFEATSSNEEEQAAEVASHPLPDMFGAQVSSAMQQGGPLWPFVLPVDLLHSSATIV